MRNPAMHSPSQKHAQKPQLKRLDSGHSSLLPRYADRLAGRMEVILLTNDAGSRRLAEEEGVRAIGAASYVRLLRPDATELLDMVAAGTVVEEDPEEEDGEGEEMKACAGSVCYTESVCADWCQR
eukprot:scaffold63769_cov20-Tisochrysis_lutea.AAC.4